jgi:hypothetical protein
MKMKIINNNNNKEDSFISEEEEEASGKRLMGNCHLKQDFDPESFSGKPPITQPFIKARLFT